MNWSVFGKAFLVETVYSIPFFILSILPFKKQLRFPIKILILFIFIGQLLQSSLYTYLISHGKPTRVTDTVFAFVSLAIYFLCVKANFWKLLFLGNFILNYFVTVRGICFFLESRLFYDPSITYYSLRDQSLLLISILLLLTLPLGLKFMKNATERVFQVDSSAFWQKVWFIPFSCTLIICAYNFDLNIDTVRKFRFILTRLWLFAMTILIYYVLLEALNAVRQQAQLEERAAQQDTLLAMQYTQYQQLSRHIEEVREARHDLRQHLNLIEHYLQSGKTEDLNTYIEQYRMTLPPDTARTWCENYAVNTIISYYGEEARKASVDFSVRIQLPPSLPLGEPQLCSIFGNLLENALDACRECTDSAPFIRICAQEDAGNNACLLDDIFYGISVTNGYAQPDSCFMFAYDLENNKLLWRSGDQTCNTMNFIVKKDVIICGYGFTSEKDYLYQLNLHTGEVIASLELKKQPDLLVPQDNMLYVHTYSYNYTIEMQ